MNNNIDTTIGLIDVGGDKAQWLSNFKNNLSSLSNEKLIEIAASWASEAEFQQQQRLKITKRLNSINAGLSFLPDLFNLPNKVGLLEWANEYEQHFNNPIIASILRNAHAKSERHQSNLNAAKANKRWELDPKSLAKARIKDNWEQWQKDLSLYKNASAFANDMLDDYPVLTSHKKITEWCTKWKKEATMQA